MVSSTIGVPRLTTWSTVVWLCDCYIELVLPPYRFRVEWSTQTAARKLYIRVEESSSLLWMAQHTISPSRESCFIPQNHQTQPLLSWKLATLFSQRRGPLSYWHILALLWNKPKLYQYQVCYHQPSHYLVPFLAWLYYPWRWCHTCIGTVAVGSGFGRYTFSPTILIFIKFRGRVWFAHTWLALRRLALSLLYVFTSFFLFVCVYTFITCATITSSTLLPCNFILLDLMECW